MQKPIATLLLLSFLALPAQAAPSDLSAKPIVRLKPLGFLGLGGLGPAERNDPMTLWCRVGNDGTMFQAYGPTTMWEGEASLLVYTDRVNDTLTSLLSRSARTEHFLTDYKSEIAVSNYWRWGTWGSLLGAVGMLNLATSSEDSTQKGMLALTSLGLSGLALVGAFVSQAITNGAADHLRDGINAYNDTLPASPSARP